MEHPSDRDWMMKMATKFGHVAAALVSLLGVGSLVIAAAILATLGTLVVKNETIALPLAIPKPLEDRGVRSDVLIERLQDDLEAIRLEVKAKHAQYRGPWDNVARLSRPDEFDVSIPSMGTTLSTLVMKVRLMLPLPYRIIKGEVICGDDKCNKTEQLRFNLRVIESEGRFMAEREKSSGKTVDTDGTTYVEGRLHKVSEQLLSHLNPLLYAAYVYSSQYDNPDERKKMRIEASRIAETAITAKQDKDKQARDYKDLGRMLLDEKVPQEALVALTKAHELDKRDYETLTSLAEAYHLLGNYSRALTAYDEAIRLYNIRRHDIASRMMEKIQQSIFTIHQTTLTAWHWLMTSKKTEEEAKYYESRGLVAYVGQNYPKAIKDFKAAARLEPSAEIDTHLGYALLELQAYEAARQAFTEARGKALETSKSAFPALFGRGIAYFSHQEYLLAEDAFQDADKLTFDQKRAKIWKQLSSVMFSPDRRHPCEKTDEICLQADKPLSWDDAVLAYLTGNWDEVKLFAKAQEGRPEERAPLATAAGEDLWMNTAEDERTTIARGQLAEAYFYVGAIHMANNEKAAAATCFRLSMNVGASRSQDFREVRMARHMADLLGPQSAIQPCIGEPAAVTMARGG